MDLGRTNLDFEIKTSKYYDGEKLRNAVMKMELFYVFAKDKNLSEKDATCAYKLFEHYRRLAICILMKEFSSDFNVDLVVNAEYMKKLFKEA